MGVAIRTAVMLAAVAGVCTVSLAATDLLARPATASVAAATRAASQPHDWGREARLEGLGEFAVQALLVAGIAIAGRKVLKIRL